MLLMAVACIGIILDLLRRHFGYIRLWLLAIMSSLHLILYAWLYIAKIYLTAEVFLGYAVFSLGTAVGWFINRNASHDG